jgi:ElaB/YqjD/DUF883 family membrane-anchored ribosome-binding protein
MDAIRELSVDDLRRESERGRAQLANTVENLRDRVSETASEIKTLVSPAHIKEEIRTYVREEREKLSDTIQRQVRENPLQAVAIGAAIAYPAWGLLRAMPMPLMLIGAGLFLTSSRGKRVMSDAQDKASEAYRQGADMASEAITSAQDTLAGRSQGISQAFDAAGAAVSETARQTFDTVTSRAEAVKQQVGAAVDQTAATAESAVASVKSAASTAKTRAGELQTNAGNAVMEFIEQNPILVAGVGAAIGAVLAASIPSSDAENRLFGPPRRALKEKASALVADGVEKAKDAAANVTGDIAEAAAREGVDGDGLKRAVEGVMASARTVADRGLSAALDGIAPNAAGDNPQHLHDSTPQHSH